MEARSEAWLALAVCRTRSIKRDGFGYLAEVSLVGSPPAKRIFWMSRSAGFLIPSLGRWVRRLEVGRPDSIERIAVSLSREARAAAPLKSLPDWMSIPVSYLCMMLRIERVKEDRILGSLGSEPFLAADLAVEGPSYLAASRFSGGILAVGHSWFYSGCSLGCQNPWLFVRAARYPPSDVALL